MENSPTPAKKSTFNWFLLGSVVFACLLPSILNLMGWDFGASRQMDQYELRGLLVHTILIWTATCMAFFAFLLSFFHYFLNRDVVMPVIGISLLWGGFMDLFQTLAADRFIQSSADYQILIPFTWAIGRTFGVLILLMGVMILMLKKYKGRDQGNLRFFILLALAFGLAALGVGDFLSHEEGLPEVVFPDMLISRPWDTLPLIIHVIAGLWVFRKFHMHRRDHFSFSVWISILPDFVAQLHMAFGSTELFDNHYVLAQLFKVISYAVPATGLLKDYVDVHRRLQTVSQENLQSERERLSLSRLVDNGTEMVAILSPQGSLNYLNTELRTSLGMDSWIASHPPALADILNTDNPFNDQNQWIDRVWAQGFIRIETELRTIDGSRLIPVELSLFPLEEVHANHKPDLGMILHDITEERHHREDRERHESELRSLVRQRTAELAEVNQKITRELDERRFLEARLVKSQKLEAMGQLSAGIAHEINNPVSYVRMNLETLERYVDDLCVVLDAYGKLDSRISTQDQPLIQAVQLKQKHRIEFVRKDAKDLLLESKDGLGKVTEIVRSLRSFSHPEAGERKPLVLNELIESALRMVHNEIKKHEVICEWSELPHVWGSAVQLSQVFVNLLLNASQAMPETGTLTIRTKRHENQVVVQIKDTGVGVPEELGNKLFEPFFTTKAIGQGTGLGLYISYGIVREHGGDMTYWSELGKGTTFRVALPIDPRSELSGNRENG